MSSRFCLDGDFVSGAEHRAYPDFVEHCGAFRTLVPSSIDVWLLQCGVFDPSLAAVDGHIESFPREVGVQGIRHLYAITVFDQDVHRVFDGDVVPKHAPVADVSAVRLGVQVQAFELWVVLDIDRKWIVFGCLAPVTAVVEVLDPTFLCCCASIEVEGSEGEYGFRLRVQPEVHQVEMVGGFVDEQPAAVRLVAVPPAVVVRTMNITRLRKQFI